MEDKATEAHSKDLHRRGHSAVANASNRTSTETDEQVLLRGRNSGIQRWREQVSPPDRYTKADVHELTDAPLSGTVADNGKSRQSVLAGGETSFEEASGQADVSDRSHGSDSLRRVGAYERQGYLPGAKPQGCKPRKQKMVRASSREELETQMTDLLAEVRECKVRESNFQARERDQDTRLQAAIHDRKTQNLDFQKKIEKLATQNREAVAEHGRNQQELTRKHKDEMRETRRQLIRRARPVVCADEKHLFVMARFRNLSEWNPQESVPSGKVKQ
ncbi:MAG: hypothetical protein OHK93_003373 [Ramalina farinacea]|uniref:Uncharacterized protein n=1 Tax=Ramalina farinacea TaxID=258253 RepID=A0AA43QVN6_9LECA|nr:hypothetical protein [Ramalina farinacea]